MVLWHINHCRLFYAKSIFIHINSYILDIQFSISTVYYLHAVKYKNSSISKILFSKQFSSIWPIDRTLSSATTPGHSRPGSNGNEGVFCIPLNSSITGALPSDCLVSYTGRLGSLTLPQRCSQCILQPQLTGPCYTSDLIPNIARFNKWLLYRYLSTHACFHSKRNVEEGDVEIKEFCED